MAVLSVGGHNPHTAQGTYPRRGGVMLSGTCIIHTSEGNWSSGVNSLTNLIKTRADYGSYHRAVDWEDIAIYFDWEWEAWQDTETNGWAVGISAACRTVDWGKDYFIANGVEEGFYRNLARCAADFVVYMKSSKGITVPLRRITGAQARARVPGFCGHGDSGISRSDPGVNFDWPRFFKYVSEALNPLSIKPIVEESMASVTGEELRVLLNAAARTNGAIPPGAARQGKEVKLLDSLDGNFIVNEIRAVGEVTKSLVGALNALQKGEKFDEGKLLSSIEERVAKAMSENAVQVNVALKDSVE